MNESKTNNHKKLHSTIEHTSLRPDLVEEGVINLCDEAIEYGFHGVCLNPINVSTAVTHTICTDLNVISVAGFPTGSGGTKAKIEETFFAATNGANEIDIVIDIRAAKEGRFSDISKEIKAIIGELDQNILIKVIIETGLLNKKEREFASLAAIDAGAQFIKTSTGFWTPAVTPEEVSSLRKIVGPFIGIKASGGIRDLRTIKALIEAGANRIGTSTAVEIFKTITS
ncbi:MAG: deoxyribose-phosphate aldolase [Candidatus Theseobacter exili]|nr:deoxyribose-phosphate aldolase [Candidatus Theseobacter exili]